MDERTRHVMGAAEVVNICRPSGCDHCAHTGFHGRTGIYEVIPLDTKLQAMIHANHSEADMERHARTFSKSMRQDGFRKILLGETTIEEVLKVTTEE
jgi:general secretion pathway protein E